MGIRIHHVNIRTRDLERTVAFYTGAIGLKQGERPGFGFSGAWLYDDEQPAIHLNAVAEEPSPTENAFDHVAFSVDALDDVLARLDSLNVRYYGLRPIPNSTLRQCFVKDPNGIIVELQGP